MTLHLSPRDRLEAIERELDDLDSEVRNEIEEQLPDVYREYVALESEKSFERHMARYVSEQYKKRQKGERPPLCTCELPTCPLSNGKLPAQIQYNPNSLTPQENGRKRVLQYVQKHRGKEVLHEMLDEWDKREGNLHRKISELLMKITKEQSKNLREVPQA